MEQAEGGETVNEKIKENVLRCPFCGNTDCVVTSTGYCNYVMCLNCGAHGPWERTIQGARDAWNKRTEQPAPHGDGVL
jgi:Lar family restriction alleviation protein